METKRESVRQRESESEKEREKIERERGKEREKQRERERERERKRGRERERERVIIIKDKNAITYFPFVPLMPSSQQFNKPFTTINYSRKNQTTLSSTVNTPQ